jgi:hypothetical protein
MGEPLDHTVLVDVDPQTQKNMIGERLYPLVYAQVLFSLLLLDAVANLRHFVML